MTICAYRLTGSYLLVSEFQVRLLKRRKGA